MEGEEGRRQRHSLAEENRQLREELKQCKADKDFVWMLWKELQKESPDMTSTVDMIVTREKLKSEQRIQSLSAALQTKDEENRSLLHELKDAKQEIADQNLRLGRMDGEMTLLESKLTSQQLETEKQINIASEAQSERRKLMEQNIELEKDKQVLLEHEKELEATIENQQKQSEQMRQECDSKALYIQDLEQEVGVLKERMAELSEQSSVLEQQLRKQEQYFHSKLTELQSVKSELIEVSRSRDAWASHTTLQSSAIQQLQKENSQLKEELMKKQNSTLVQAEVGQSSSQGPSIGSVKVYSSEQEHKVGRMDGEHSAQRKKRRIGRRKDDRRIEVDQRVEDGEPQGSMERELFETRLQLEAKNEELECLRTSHDRRLKRMEALQESHNLLLEQLKTYESFSSQGPKVVKKEHKRTPAKALRHENSEAVWNELALYQEKCQQLEWQLLLLEEERDTLKAKCLRSQSSLSELRTRLQHEKNDLERKLSAIAKVEEDSSRNAPSETSELQVKIKELEAVISGLQQEKASLSSQCRTAEKECHQLREDAAEMQTHIMELSHKVKLQELKMISKSTMTDRGSPSHYDSISVTDSATQVDLIPTKPHLKDAQVSPFQSPQTSPDNAGRGRIGAPVKGKMKVGRLHRRTQSEGDALFYKKRAKDAYRRVKKVSKELQQLSKVRQPVELSLSESLTTEDEEERTSLQTQTQHGTVTTNAESCSSKPGLKEQPQKASESGPHKCTWQQQVKALQKKLRSVNKQLSVASSMRQSLSQTLEEERREKARAKTEVKELTVRLQGMRTVVQSLQGEVQRVSAVNQQLEQRVASLSDTKRGRTEVDWKRMESEKRVLSDKCSSLSESVKSLEGKLQLKAEELNEAQIRFSWLERDLKQKRQLLDSQREKMKKVKQQASKDKENLQCIEGEVQGLSESLSQSRNKVETLHVQLSKQTEDKTKLMGSLASCQEELAQTLQQLATCQKDCERKKLLLTQVKHSSQQEVVQLQKKHAQKVETMETQMRNKERFLEEHKQFVRGLASALEQHLTTMRHKHVLRGRERKQAHTSSDAVASRVREIAKTTLNLSDLEVDEFFSDEQEQEEELGLCGLVEGAMSKESQAQLCAMMTVRCIRKPALMVLLSARHKRGDKGEDAPNLNVKNETEMQVDTKNSDYPTSLSKKETMEPHKPIPQPHQSHRPETSPSLFAATPYSAPAEVPPPVLAPAADTAQPTPEESGKGPPNTAGDSLAVGGNPSFSAEEEHMPGLFRPFSGNEEMSYLGLHKENNSTLRGTLSLAVTPEFQRMNSGERLFLHVCSASEDIPSQLPLPLDTTVSKVEISADSGCASLPTPG